MLNKINSQTLNTAYLCSTNAKFMPLHCTPVNAFQASTVLSKANTRVKKMLAQGTVSPIAQALQTVIFMPNAPWCNGYISPLSLHPIISQSITSMIQTGVNLQNPAHFIDHLQIHLQTQNYFEAESEWGKTVKISEQAFNKCMQRIMKNVSGIEILEFNLNCDFAQNGSLQFASLISLINSKLLEQLNIFEPDNFVALFLKKEPCINQKINIRFIVVLQKNFIDEPFGFSDSNFFEQLKYIIESSSGYTLDYSALPLNGFLQTRRFNKKSADFKDCMKYLKLYLIGTDTLYRVDGLQSTFEIVYSKFN